MEGLEAQAKLKVKGENAADLGAKIFKAQAMVAKLHLTNNEVISELEARATALQEREQVMNKKENEFAALSQKWGDMERQVQQWEEGRTRWEEEKAKVASVLALRKDEVRLDVGV